MSQTQHRAPSARRPQQAPPRRGTAPGRSRGTYSGRQPQTGRPAQRPKNRPTRASAPVRSGGIAPDLLTVAAVGLVCIIAAFLLQRAWPDGFPLKTRESSAGSSRITEIHASGTLRINEIMPSNRQTLTDASGASTDWIELYNAGNSPVSLSGYTLSKTANSANVLSLPDMTLGRGECLLIYADSRLRDDENDELHAPFRLSAAGDTLMLFNSAGSAVDTVNIPAVGADMSYARTDSGHWEITSKPTPGLENTEEAYRSLTEPATYSPVILSEVMPSNASTLADEKGYYADYIELYNQSGDSVDISGWYLSDDAGNVRKWRIPEGTIEPGGTLIIFASGFDRTEDPAHFHTNFRLNSEGETVLLSDAGGRVMDSMSYDLAKKDVAFTRAQDGSWSSAQAPSPGKR